MNIALAIYILAFGVVRVDVPATDRTHLYYFETSTNLAAGWDNTDAALFLGSPNPQQIFIYPQ